MKARMVLLSLLFCSSFVYSADSVLTISKAIQLAEEYNLDVKRSTFEKYAAEAQVSQAYAAYWPKVDLMAKTNNGRIWQSQDYRPSSDQQSQINAALLYTIYDFGARSNQVDAAKFSLEGSQIKEALQKETLVYDVFKAFIQYDYSRLTYTLTEDYLNRVNHLYGLTKQRVDAGFSAQSDQIRAELALSEANSRVKTASQGLTDSKIILSNVIGVNPEQIDSLLSTDFAYHHDVNKIIVSSTATNPAIKMMLSNSQMLKAKMDSVRAERYPKLQVIGTYRQDFGRDSFPGSEAYIQLTVPLTDGGLLRAKAREAAYNHEAAKLTLEQSYRELDKRQRDFINIYHSAIDKLNIDLQSATQSQRTLDIYQSEFSLGNRPLTDLISAHKDLLMVNAEILSDKMNAYLAVLSLYNLNGDTLTGVNLLTKK